MNHGIHVDLSIEDMLDTGVELSFTSNSFTFVRVGAYHTKTGPLSFTQHGSFEGLKRVHWIYGQRNRNLEWVGFFTDVIDDLVRVGESLIFYMADGKYACEYESSDTPDTTIFATSDTVQGLIDEVVRLSEPTVDPVREQVQLSGRWSVRDPAPPWSPVDINQVEGPHEIR